MKLSSSNTSNLETRACSIERFRGINYLTWRTKVEMFLCKSDNFNVVKGTDPNLGTWDQTTFKVWTLKDDRARFDLIFQCGDVQIQMVCQLKAFKEVWEKLKMTYVHSNQTTQLVVQKKLMTIKF